MRVWTHDRIAAGDALTPWALRGRVASAASALSAVDGENFPDTSIDRTRLERAAAGQLTRVQAASVWDDEESIGEHGWRAIDDMSADVTFRGGWLRVRALVRWQDWSAVLVGGNENGYPRQLGLKVGGALVAIGPQQGAIPSTSSLDKQAFFGTSRLSTGLLVGAGAQRVELVYRNFALTQQLVAPGVAQDDPRQTRFHNRRMLIMEHVR